jgi:hypothetical protein
MRDARAHVKTPHGRNLLRGSVQGCKHRRSI